MQVKNSNGYESFDSGLLSICDADERALISTKVEKVRFGDRTIGATRFWQAKTAGNKVDRMLSIPLDVANTNLIEVNDVVIIDADNMKMPGQYKILQIQSKFDTKPPALYLSLEKAVHLFKDKRSKNGD